MSQPESFEPSMQSHEIGDGQYDGQPTTEATPAAEENYPDDGNMVAYEQQQQGDAPEEHYPTEGEPQQEDEAYPEEAAEPAAGEEEYPAPTAAEVPVDESEDPATQEQWHEVGDEPAETPGESVPPEEAAEQQQWREVGDEAEAPEEDVPQEQQYTEADPQSHYTEDAEPEQQYQTAAPLATQYVEEPEQQYPEEAGDQYPEEPAIEEPAPDSVPPPEEQQQEQWHEVGDGEAPPAPEEAAAPEQGDEWREVGDEGAAAAPRDAPAAEPAGEEQWHELGDESGPAAGTYLVKPKTRKVKRVIRWEPIEYDPREDSDDEFDMATCMNPVYEGDDEQPPEGSVFKNGSPDCDGEVLSCFDEPNLLYRIINREQKTWAFYNDSLNYEMHVQFTFGKNSKLEPLENTKMEKNADGQYVTEVIVYPTETEMFVHGTVNGFTSKLRAVPLSEEYHLARHNISEEQVQKETKAVNRVSGGSDNAEEVLQCCIANNIPFVDPEFPPCQDSLDKGAKKPFKHLAWARPSMYLPPEMAGQVRLFRTTIKPGVVDAGDLGDSWVMCSVASVSETPARLMGMFRHPEGKDAAMKERSVGAYRVTFSKNGWWRSVLVDDYLPISAGRPKYARSANDPAEIWPCILQKAYAKLHGSYATICSGDPLHALQDMTGFSTVRFDDAMVTAASSGDTILFDSVAEGIKAGYTVICSTPGKDPKNAGSTGPDSQIAEEYKAVGLVTGHAYTILDAKAFPEIGTHIVKVRNAWGRGLEWSGDWGDEDSKWDENPEVAEACNFQKAADGTFWMPWAAALKYFNGGGMCFSHEPAYDHRVNCGFMECVPSSVLEVDVQSPTWIAFVISQEDKRGRSNVTDYQPVMISVAAPTDNDLYKVILNSTADGAHPTSEKWTFLQARDVTLINKFEPGKYIVIPRLMPMEGQAEEVPFVLGVISNKEVGAGEVSISFKHLDKTNRVFENFPKFEPELIPVEEEVQFQKRVPGSGFPATMMGAALE